MKKRMEREGLRRKEVREGEGGTGERRGMQGGCWHAIKLKFIHISSSLSTQSLFRVVRPQKVHTHTHHLLRVQEAVIRPIPHIKGSASPGVVQRCPDV